MTRPDDHASDGLAGAEAQPRPAAAPRPRPCATCPYRQSVPSGVWHESEYRKLEAYDGDMTEQESVAVFYCHQGDGQVCSGWLGHRDPADLLAVRIGLMEGRLDPSCITYETAVPLFASGSAASAHGCSDMAAPTMEASAAIAKIIRTRTARRT